MSEPAERLLVLAVDRDGDLESKTNVRTPVRGRDEVVAAATKLAISDPEEADANSIFAAVREHERLKERGIDSEVAVVSGVSDSGIDADRKIRREVERLLSGDSFTGVVLVSDGADDEQVLPVIQSLKPITSVVRIAVKYSRTVEETYMVLGRYLRMLVFDQRYSKWAVGVPGVILLFAGLLVLFGRAFEAEVAILIIVGGTFLVRGFGIDRSVAQMLSQRPYGYLRIFSVVAGTLIFLVGISSGFTYINAKIPSTVALVSATPSQFLVYGPLIVGSYLEGSLPIIWAALGVYFTGALLAHLARGSNRVWRDGVVIVILGLLYFPMDEFAIYLTGVQNSSVVLISYVLVTLACAFAAVTAVYPRIRSRTQTQTLKE